MLTWIQEKSPRDRKCYASTQSGVVWPMAKLYMDKAFHKENKEAAGAHLLYWYKRTCLLVQRYTC